MVKIILAALLFAAPAFAQDSSTAALAAAGCGASDVEFKVKTDKKQHPLPTPTQGKAAVVVISQFGGVCVGGCITTRVGIDAKWVGANESNSYLSFAIAPGDHRVCVAYQSRLKGRSETASAISLTAEAGKVYFFKAGLFHNSSELKLEPVDSAEGPLLAKSAPFATSELKKPAANH